MSWESNRDKGKQVDPYRRRNNLRRMRERVLEEEPIDNFRWDVEDEREAVKNSKEGAQETMG